MVRLIAALDSKRGLATDAGIPWDLPADKRQYRQLCQQGLVLMGGATYGQFREPLGSQPNFVLTSQLGPLRDGFVAVHDLAAFMAEHPRELINDIGGAKLYAASLPYADELRLTQVAGDFGCSKFFPDYTADFTLTSQSEPHTENGITFRFQTWRRRQPAN